eukprot:2442547-Pyramimonas_sp.AAC.1
MQQRWPRIVPSPDVAVPSRISGGAPSQSIRARDVYRKSDDLRMEGSPAQKCGIFGARPCWSAAFSFSLVAGCSSQPALVMIACNSASAGQPPRKATV